MVPHPDTIVTVADLRRQDLLATAANARPAQSAARPALVWRDIAVRALAFLALLPSLRV